MHIPDSNPTTPAAQVVPVVPTEKKVSRRPIKDASYFLTAAAHVLQNSTNDPALHRLAESLTKISAQLQEDYR